MVNIKKESSHIGWLIWLIHKYGKEFRLTLAEIGSDANGMSYEPVRYHLIALEKLGYLVVDKKYRPHKFVINFKKLEEELGVKYEGV